jgi:hypothetical protein
MNYDHERGYTMARYIFSDSYAATVLPIIREIHREILARKPPGAISNRAIDRAIARALAARGVTTMHGVNGCEDPRIDGVRRNGDETSTAVGSMLFAGKEKRGGMGRACTAAPWNSSLRRPPGRKEMCQRAER